MSQNVKHKGRKRREIAGFSTEMGKSGKSAVNASGYAADAVSARIVCIYFARTL